MDNMTIIAVVSTVTAGLTIALGSIGPALGNEPAAGPWWDRGTGLAQPPG